MENQIENEIKEPIIGEFKTKRKYNSFVSAASGAKVRFIRETAFLKGKRLSGMLENVIFKMTICDEGTINFEEVDGNTVDREMISRLIEDIDSHPHTGYAQKFVVKGLEFEDADGDLCYLEVEEKKPIDKLKSLFEEKPEISEKGLGFLDDLFGVAEDESEDVDGLDETTSSNEEEANTELPNAKSESKIYMEESFRKMNEEKANELKKRVAEFESDILKYTRDIKSAEAKLGEINEKLAITQTRLESLTPGEESNGYVFFVSQEQKLETGLDESTKAIADKIADIMKLKKEVLFDYLTEGFYKIRIAKKEDLESKVDDDDIVHKIAGIDISGSFSQTEPGELEYRGKLDWHMLVAKMIRNGFEQSEEFDRLCGSNSYESKDAEE